MHNSFNKSKILLLAFAFLMLSIEGVNAQKGNHELGAWYGYFFDTDFGESNFGIMGDVQQRSFNVTNDFQQLILRAGLSYKIPGSSLRAVAGYSYFNSGTFGPSNKQSFENRMYQDLIWNNQFFEGRIALLHRIRLEERFVENQDFRTRYRYFLNAKLPLNKKVMGPNTFFLWAAGEVFVNGQQQIDNGRTVSLYDRTWLFGGVGYQIRSGLRAELSYMREVTNTQTKGQLIVSLFHTF
ncbi:DUF2490 domain-containing protein [Leeuwenhoekiella aestuarii]|uniref:DUF2490 domain-containing protein n=1 Tax=Leeuwenhoekiella aestuarii TaxID=2249426 RepID=A0A4Q0NX40_9FLAO|nr:DUF2490 domain-containing protein [Leeuwenhoekiella aestuarii]RXG15360.1 putative protein DUF2490 [Leeuwenhoekiella aestuarii]